MLQTISCEMFKVAESETQKPELLDKTIRI